MQLSGLRNHVPRALASARPPLPRHLGTALEDATAISPRQAVHGRSLASC